MKRPEVYTIHSEEYKDLPEEELMDKAHDTYAQVIEMLRELRIRGFIIANTWITLEGEKYPILDINKIPYGGKDAHRT